MRAKTWQTWSAAFALTLLGGGVAQAQSLSETAAQAGFLNEARPSAARIDNSARPSAARIGDSARYAASSNVGVPKTANEFFNMFPGVTSSEPEKPVEQGKKRYLVCFLQTMRFAYDDVKDRSGKLIVKKGNVYDEPLRACIEASYCAAGITLRSLGNFDEMITVADQYLNKAQVKAVFDALAEKTREGDEIFIYWNGHGGMLATDNNGDEREGGVPTEGQSADVDTMVALYETNPNAPNDAAMRALCLSDDELGAQFSKLKGRKVVAFFETCHSGGLGRDATAREFGSGVRGTALVAPKPELVTTWADLKSEVDATDELLKVAGLAFAMQGFKTGFTVAPAEGAETSESGETTENAASESGAGEGGNYSNDSPSDSESSVVDMFEDGAKGTDDAGDSESESDSESVRDTFEQEGSKTLNSDEYKDISRDTLNNLAVAFTSAPDQSSWAATRYVDAENNVRYVHANPGAFSIFLAFRIASEAKEPLTFEYLSYVMSATIRENEGIANRVARANDKPEAPQEAHFLSNWDDAVLFDPSWEFYWDEKWSEGGEKWKKKFAELQATENAQ